MAESLTYPSPLRRDARPTDPESTEVRPRRAGSAVRRWAGPAAGLIAGTLVALTPVAALMFRFTNPTHCWCS